MVPQQAAVGLDARGSRRVGSRTGRDRNVTRPVNGREVIGGYVASEDHPRVWHSGRSHRGILCLFLTVRLQLHDKIYRLGPHLG